MAALASIRGGKSGLFLVFHSPRSIGLPLRARIYELYIQLGKPELHPNGHNVDPPERLARWPTKRMTHLVWRPGFDWFPAKRLRVLRERGIDFIDAAKILLRPVYEYQSDREGEQRFVAIGPLPDGALIAVVYTLRGQKVRIITARPARTGEKMPTYTLTQLRRMKGRTDFDRLRQMTDDEIEKSIANDPDWAEFKKIDWSKAQLVIPVKKRAISIRIDSDVLAYFKHEGAGYQRRMNAVLRSYVEQKRNAPARKKKRA